MAVFALVVATAIFGTSRPIENLSPAFVWIIWWVGMAYVAALVGNVWRVLNPWKILFEWGEKLLGDGSDERDVGIFRYPERLDVWPALMLFLVFAWLESVYSVARRSHLRDQQAHRKPVARLRVDHLVGRDGLRCRAGGQRVEGPEPVEDTIRVGREAAG